MKRRDRGIETYVISILMVREITRHSKTTAVLQEPDYIKDVFYVQPYPGVVLVGSRFAGVDLVLK